MSVSHGHMNATFEWDEREPWTHECDSVSHVCAHASDEREPWTHECDFVSHACIRESDERAGRWHEYALRSPIPISRPGSAGRLSFNIRTSRPETARPRNCDKAYTSRMTIAGAILAALAAAALLISGPGTRWEWFGFKVGLLLFAVAFIAGLLALLISGVAWFRTRPNPVAAVATIAGALIVLLPLTQVAGARGKPRIHDISTDLADPPRFSAILPLRGKAANAAPDRIDDATATLQRAGYPDLCTLDLPLSADAAFAKAVEAAKAMDWHFVSMRPSDGIIEATATTAWFGFHDDIVVRIRPAAERSRIDVRSTSRVGRGDAGKNADRIRKYLRLLTART
jgi:hypothetical protein